MRLNWSLRLVPGSGVHTLVNTSLTSREAVELQGFTKGRSVLEIGSACGYSAIAMVIGGAKHVLAVDPHLGEVPGSLKTMRENLAAYNALDRVSMVLSRSQVVLPRLVECNAYFDAVFIDGDHSHAAVAADLELASQLVGPQGLVLLHDYGEDTCPGVQYAIDDRCRRARLRGHVVTDTLFFGKFPSLDGFDDEEAEPHAA